MSCEWVNLCKASGSFKSCSLWWITTQEIYLRESKVAIEFSLNYIFLLLSKHKSQVLKGALSRIGAVQTQEPCQGQEEVAIYYVPFLHAHPLNLFCTASCCTVYTAKIMFFCCYPFGIHCPDNDFLTEYWKDLFKIYL